MQPIKRLASTDKLYRQGMLSSFPREADTRDSLYYVKNNAETTLRQSLTMSSKYVVLEDAGNFPNSGLIKVSSPRGGESEIIYYGIKAGNQLYQLQRGFGGSRQSAWSVGSVASLPVMADHHNTLKDAIIRIEQMIGLSESPEPESVNGVLTSLERKWLAPKPVFKAYPTAGSGPLKVRFQNLSVRQGFRFLWDFGDGSTSTERSPLHVYAEDGLYTVQLTMVSPNGASGLARKPDYMTVSKEEPRAFFYVSEREGKAGETSFELIDQTNAEVLERHWFFGDGEDATVSDPFNHAVSHVYSKPGEYRPSLLARLAGNKIVKAFSDIISVI